MLSADAPDSSATPQVSVELNQRWNEEPRFGARNMSRPRSYELVLALRMQMILWPISTQRCALPHREHIGVVRAVANNSLQRTR